MPTNNAFTEAEQVYYDQFDEAVTASRFQRLGHAHHRDDSAINDDELSTILCGHPNVWHDRTTGKGTSRRRQVRPPEATGDTPDA